MDQLRIVERPNPSNIIAGWRRAGMLLACFVSLAIIAIYSCTPAGADPPGGTSGWTQTFSDDFRGNSLNTNNWIPEATYTQNGAPPAPIGLWITDRWDDAAMSYVKAGGAIWLLSHPAESEDKATFLPAFGGKQGTVIGNHPTLDGFPHTGLCDLQFFNLIENARYFSLDAWPHGIDPAIGGIRAKTNFLSFSKDLSRFGYLFEAKVGKGKLLVSALNLLKPLAEQRPEAVALVDGILRYATGTVFEPNVQIDDTRLATLRNEANHE